MNIDESKRFIMRLPKLMRLPKPKLIAAHAAARPRRGAHGWERSRVGLTVVTSCTVGSARPAAPWPQHQRRSRFAHGAQGYGAARTAGYAHGAPGGAVAPTAVTVRLRRARPPGPAAGGRACCARGVSRFKSSLGFESQWPAPCPGRATNLNQLEATVSGFNLCDSKLEAARRGPGASDSDSEAGPDADCVTSLVPRFGPACKRRARGTRPADACSVVHLS